MTGMLEDNDLRVKRLRKPWEMTLFMIISLKSCEGEGDIIMSSDTIVSKNDPEIQTLDPFLCF